MTLVDEIDALLPQTQCGECSYAGCLPYAQALAQGSERINRCPPGGAQLVKDLGLLLNVDSAGYLEEATANTRTPSVAIIQEAECIGCTKCIQACPVDAIIGSSKAMHAVITHECTGCGLCVEPCPVDCIEMHPLEEPAYQPELARKRYQAKKIRALRVEHEKQQSYREKRLTQDKKDVENKQAYIQAALARVQAKKSHE
jgi:electron transport complex protein RnfB